jgi:uncharacterized protein YajQ (UPF0234 family)
VPSFDVVSELNQAEVDNALNQCKKELGQRYDFRGTSTEIERTPEGLVLRSSDEEHLNAAYKVLMERMVKRSVSLKALDPQTLEPATKNTVRQLIKLREGIPTEKGKELVKMIKDSKLKVQAQIQDEQLRVTSKSKDELQQAIALLRRADFELDLQFINFRD